MSLHDQQILMLVLLLLGLFAGLASGFPVAFVLGGVALLAAGVGVLAGLHLLAAFTLMATAGPALAETRYWAFDAADRVTQALTRGITLEIDRGFFGGISVRTIHSTSARGRAAPPPDIFEKKRSGALHAPQMRAVKQRGGDPVIDQGQGRADDGQRGHGGAAAEAGGLSFQGVADLQPTVALCAKGGIAGQKIELVQMDDKFDAKLAAENARKLIVERNVMALFLTRGTPTSQAASPGVQV